MELKKAIENRQSIRSFKSDEDISREKIKEIIELSLRAPSAGNIQPWRIIAIRDDEIKRKLAVASYNQNFVAQAPWVLTVVAQPHISGTRYGTRGEELYSIQDTSALIQTLLLILVDEGLATCWVGAFDEGSVTEILNIKHPSRPVAILPVGYPAERPRFTGRKSVEDVVEWME